MSSLIFQDEEISDTAPSVRRGYKSRTTIKQIRPISIDDIEDNNKTTPKDDNTIPDDDDATPEPHVDSLLRHDFPTRPIGRTPLRIIDDESIQTDVLLSSKKQSTSRISNIDVILNSNKKDRTTNTNTATTTTNTTQSILVPRSESTGRIVYITERLLRKATKTPRGNMNDIKSLNLHLPKRTGSRSFGQIRFIENLHMTPSLRSLNLSYNIICKMENFRALTRLRDLNLAENNLTQLSCLNELKQLKRLNVSGNRIVHLPPEVSLLLKLEEFRIARNKLCYIDEIRALKDITTLRMLSISGNPMMEESTVGSSNSSGDDGGGHAVDSIGSSTLSTSAGSSTASTSAGSIDFVLFALRSIDVLDGNSVSERSRKKAIDRYEQKEVERVSNIASEALEHAKMLQEKLDVQMESTIESDLYATKNEQEANDMERKNDHYKMELLTKNNLLLEANDRLTKTNEIMYGLEQRLAMDRIDHETIEIVEMNATGMRSRHFSRSTDGSNNDGRNTGGSNTGGTESDSLPINTATATPLEICLQARDTMHVRMNIVVNNVLQKMQIVEHATKETYQPINVQHSKHGLSLLHLQSDQLRNTNKNETEKERIKQNPKDEQEKEKDKAVVSFEDRQSIMQDCWTAIEMLEAMNENEIQNENMIEQLTTHLLKERKQFNTNISLHRAVVVDDTEDGNNERGTAKGRTAKGRTESMRASSTTTTATSQRTSQRTTTSSSSSAVIEAIAYAEERASKAEYLARSYRQELFENNKNNNQMENEHNEHQKEFQMQNDIRQEAQEAFLSESRLIEKNKTHLLHKANQLDQGQTNISTQLITLQNEYQNMMFQMNTLIQEKKEQQKKNKKNKNNKQKNEQEQYKGESKTEQDVNVQDSDGEEQNEDQNASDTADVADATDTADAADAVSADAAPPSPPPYETIKLKNQLKEERKERKHLENKLIALGNDLLILRNEQKQQKQVIQNEQQKQDRERKETTISTTTSSTNKNEEKENQEGIDLAESLNSVSSFPSSPSSSSSLSSSSTLLQLENAITMINELQNQNHVITSQGRRYETQINTLLQEKKIHTSTETSLLEQIQTLEHHQQQNQTEHNQADQDQTDQDQAEYMNESSSALLVTTSSPDLELELKLLSTEKLLEKEMRRSEVCAQTVMEMRTVHNIHVEALGELNDSMNELVEKKRAADLLLRRMAMEKNEMNDLLLDSIRKEKRETERRELYEIEMLESNTKYKNEMKQMELEMVQEKELRKQMAIEKDAIERSSTRAVLLLTSELEEYKFKHMTVNELLEEESERRKCLDAQLTTMTSTGKIQKRMETLRNGCSFNFYASSLLQTSFIAIAFFFSILKHPNKSFFNVINIFCLFF